MESHTQTLAESHPLCILHLVSGDLWAGAEAQAFSLIKCLMDNPQVSVRVVLFNDGELARKLRSASVPTTIIDENVHGPIAITRALLKLMRSDRPDVFHSHRYKENILGGLAARWAAVPRLVTTVHGLPEPFKGIRSARMRLYQWLNRRFLSRYFDRIICVSRDIENTLTKSVPSSKLTTIHNAIEPAHCVIKRDRAEIRHEIGLTNQHLLLGAAGRLVEIKGLDVLLKAANMLRARQKSIRIIIIGDGPEGDHLRDLASELGLNDYVIFTGFRPDVHDLLSVLDGLVLPSLGEGVPVVILEAMALKVPIVATRVGGIPEILEDGRTAMLVNPGDPGGLAQACEVLLANKPLARRLTQAAYAHLISHLTVESMTERVISVYRNGIA